MKKIFYTSLLIGLFTCQLFAKVGVVINKDLYPFVQQSITQYIFDMNQIEKKSVWLEKSTFDAAGDIFALRDSLRWHYENDSLEGVVFVGDLPIAYYEIENDYHKLKIRENVFGYGYASFPIDIFYMDLDGVWSDNAKDGDWDGNAQTGFFDAHTGNKLAEIWVSRITAGATSGLGNEPDLVNAYFKKVHNFVIGNFNAPERCLILGDDDSWGGFESWANAGRLGYDEDSVDTYLRSRREDTHINWAQGLARGYESALIAEHSSENGHGVIGGYTSDDYLHGETTNTRFYNLFACSNSRYTTPNFLGGLYAWGHNGLVSVGSTKTGSMLNFDSYYTPMSNDSSFGESFKSWLNKKVLDNNSVDNISWHYGMVLCGDGALHFKSKETNGIQLRVTPEVVEDSARISFLINDPSMQGHLIPIGLYREDGSLVNYYRHTITLGENMLDVWLGTYPQGTYKIKLNITNTIVDSVTFRIMAGFLTVSSEQINFGETEIGQTGSKILKLINNGKRDITVTGVAFDNASFTSDMVYSLLIPAKSQKNLTVMYNPTGMNERETGTMTILTNKEQSIEVSLIGAGVYKTNLDVSPSVFRTGAVVSFETKNPAFIERIADFDLYQIFRNGAQRILVQQFTAAISSGTNTLSKQDWDYLQSGYYQLEMSIDQKLLASSPFEKLNSANVTGFSVSPSTVVDRATVTFNTESTLLVGKTAYLVCRQSGRDISSQSITIVEGKNEVTIPFNSYNSLPAGDYTMVLMFSSLDLASANFTKEDKSASLTISPIRIAFGLVTVGSQQSTQLTFTNTGNSNAIISAINFSKSVFTHNEVLPITVAPKQSVTVDLTFAPTASGKVDDELMVINAPDENVQILKISVTGTGVEKQKNISVKLVPDNDIFGNFIQSQIRIKNSGSTPVDLSNLVLEYYTYDPNANVNNLRCDIYYCSAGYASASFRKLPFVMGNSSNKADLVTEISLSGTLGANQEMSLQYGTHSADWQYMFNETDDWSHVTGSASTSSNIVIRNKVTGEILSGNMPQ